MYIMNLSDFRKDISSQFNRALDEPVYIERGGVTFVLSYSMTSKQMLEKKNRKTQELAAAIGKTHVSTIKESPTLFLDATKGTNTTVQAPPTVMEIVKNNFESDPLEMAKQFAKVQNDPRFSGRMKFCKNGHAIPEGRDRCLGKGCKYA